MLDQFYHLFKEYYPEKYLLEQAEYYSFEDSLQFLNLKEICGRVTSDEHTAWRTFLDTLNNDDKIQPLSFRNTTILALTPCMQATSLINLGDIGAISIYISLLAPFCGMRLTGRNLLRTNVSQLLEPQLFLHLKKCLEDTFKVTYLDETLSDLAVEQLADFNGNKLLVFDALFTPLHI